MNKVNSGIMAIKRVVVTDTIDKRGIEILKKGAEVIYLPEMPGRTLSDEISRAHAILVRGRFKIDRNIIEQGKDLLIIAKTGVGVDTIDIEAATEKRIVVTNTPAANYISVAEHTIGLMLSLCRNICISDRLLREGKLKKREDYTGIELEGKTLGLIGMGRIGSELAQKCKIAFRMPIIYFDPYVPQQKTEQSGYKKIEKLDDLLKESDFVAICTALTRETTNLIGAEELASLKVTAFLVNSARGGIVNEQELYNCLLKKRIAGAACDAFVVEPPPPDSPLLTLDNFIATPHIGGVTEESVLRMTIQAAEEIMRVLQGQRPLYAINPDVLSSK